MSLYNKVSLLEMGRLYERYAIALSSTAARSTGILKHPVNIVNLRSFEIPMYGGLQFCAYSEELANYFEEDKQIVFYHNEEEMLDKARFYLLEKNKQLVLKMKVSAYERAKQEHTWMERFKKIQKKLDLT